MEGDSTILHLGIIFNTKFTKLWNMILLEVHCKKIVKNMQSPLLGSNTDCQDCTFSELFDEAKIIARHDSLNSIGFHN